MFRTHQKQLLQVVRQIKSGAPWRQIIAQVTPGGGKSALPVIMAAELIPTLADKICWVVPRVALQQQAEEAFLDANFRAWLSHKCLIRVSTNEPDPPRGLTGYSTTYAALSTDSRKHNLTAFSKHRYMLVLDEPHHMAEDSSAMRAVAPLMEKAALTLFMSGTLERGRSEKIAFLPYAVAGGGDTVLSLKDSDKTKVIRYTRSDALAEHAIIPLRFTYLDVKAEWIVKGKHVSVDSFKDVKKKDETRRALFTGLQTEYAMDLLDTTVADWQATRKSNPRSKLLVVAPTQKLAKKYTDYLHQKYRLSPGLATVDEGAGALKAIRKFKKTVGDRSDSLVTVGMAYEGLDVKPITHIACLTRIRSKPWIEQMLARATRFDPDAGSWENQEAHVFVPDDAMMHRITDLIKKEEAMVCKTRYSTGSGGSGGVQRDLFGEIIAVGSTLSGKRSVRLHITPSKLTPVEVVLTPSQREEILRESIESDVRQYALRKHIPIRKANAKVMSRFGKSRALMRLDELQEVWRWVQQHFRS